MIKLYLEHSIQSKRSSYLGEMKTEATRSSNSQEVDLYGMENSWRIQVSLPGPRQMARINQFW